MLKILQARLQQYVNCELPDVQADFRKGRGTRDQIANICWVIKKAKEYQKKTSISALLTSQSFSLTLIETRQEISIHSLCQRTGCVEFPWLFSVSAWVLVKSPCQVYCQKEGAGEAPTSVQPRCIRQTPAEH